MNKIFKIVLILMIVFLNAGCTKYMREDNKQVTYPKTGQVLPSNILCKPSGEELYNFYSEHNDKLEIKLEDLPSCDEFTPASVKYSNLWETIFIKPIAWVILFFGKLFKNYGLAVMFMSLLIRVLLIPITKKTMEQSKMMKKVQPEMEKIQRKYQNKQDKASMAAQSQEMMMLYQKYKIRPMSSCLGLLIQLPLFFAFLEAINRVPAIFEDSLFGFNLGMTPVVGIRNGNYFYILLIIIILLSTFFSFRASMKNQPQNGSSMLQGNMMMIMMMVMIGIASINLSTAIAFYWIVNNVFAIIQSYIISKERN